MYHLNEYELIKILLNKKVYTWKKVELAKSLKRLASGRELIAFISFFRSVLHVSV